MKSEKVSAQNGTPLAQAQVVTPNELGISPVESSRMSQEYSLYIRSLQLGWRQGTVACLGRGEVVSRSNRKPWKQKGTGRARAGSARSPLWRGGGVIFGPQERVRITKIDKKIKKGVLNEMLINSLNQQKVFSLNWAPLNEIPKTKLAYQALQAAGFSQKRVVLLLNAQDVLSYASFANIANVRILFFDQPNAYDLSLGDCWMFLEKDRELFKTMVSQWA